MKKYKIWDDCAAYWNQHVDFISSSTENAMEPVAVVSSMHSLILLITGNMSKYYEPGIVAAFLKHALAHCVLYLVVGFP